MYGWIHYYILHSEEIRIEARFNTNKYRVEDDVLESNMLHHISFMKLTHFLLKLLIGA